jgi:hypothetical protein
MSGVVLFRPGNELLWLFRRGRVVIETPSEAIKHCHLVLFLKRTSH